MRWIRARSGTTSLTTTYVPNASEVMKKLTGCGEENAIVNPSHVNASARAMPMAMATPGRHVNLTAMAAGGTMRAQSLSTRTPWTDRGAAEARTPRETSERGG